MAGCKLQGWCHRHRVGGDAHNQTSPGHRRDSSQPWRLGAPARVGRVPSPASKFLTSNGIFTTSRVGWPPKSPLTSMSLFSHLQIRNGRYASQGEGSGRVRVGTSKPSSQFGVFLPLQWPGNPPPPSKCFSPPGLIGSSGSSFRACCGDKHPTIVWPPKNLRSGRVGWGLRNRANLNA